jgi:hypothetical protein
MNMHMPRLKRSSVCEARACFQAASFTVPTTFCNCCTSVASTHLYLYYVQPGPTVSAGGSPEEPARVPRLRFLAVSSGKGLRVRGHFTGPPSVHMFIMIIGVLTPEPLTPPTLRPILPKSAKRTHVDHLTINN